jgi:hypothetical protein
MQVVFSQKEIKQFEKIVSPIDEQIKAYSKQNTILVSLKDLLLSKLATIEN